MFGKSTWNCIWQKGLVHSDEMNLEQLLADSVDSAQAVLSDMLGKCPMPQSNEFVERILNREPIVVNLGLANLEWQGILTMGGTVSDLMSIFQVDSVDLCVDAMGEVLNTVAGTVAAYPGAKDLFGQMNQTTPVMLEGGTFFPKAPSRQADFFFESARLHYGIAIRKVFGG